MSNSRNLRLHNSNKFQKKNELLILAHFKFTNKKIIFSFVFRKLIP